MSPRWWEDCVGYEIYIRSFFDGDGDGVGDLLGIVDRLDYLAWLGVDAIWITPFFRSPMIDGGYDVADYTDVDPLFGTLADIDLLIERAHRLGLRVLADIVANHSSIAHAWFQEALRGRDSEFRDYYLWRDPAPDGSPPNNWLSHFGGPAWTLDRTSGQYYCHLFLPEQPDLNWRNPAIHLEFESILRHWLERGLDGFRVDVAHGLYKDAMFRDNPVRRPVNLAMTARERFFCLEHRHDLNQPETLDVYRSWNAIAEEHDAVLVGETYVETAEELGQVIDGTGLHVGFWFAPMQLEWNRADIHDTLTGAVDHVGRGTGWVLSSHDDPRPVTRFGGGETGRRRSLGLTTLLFGLPGLPFVYQGEELGLEDAPLLADQIVDAAHLLDAPAASRDAMRTPIPWQRDGANLGFSTAERTWLPVTHQGHESVAAQADDPTSHLSRFRNLIALRRAMAISPDAAVEWIVDPEIVGFWRGDHFFGLNPSAETRQVQLGARVDVIFRTCGESLDDEADTDRGVAIEPDQALVARRVRSESEEMYAW